MMLAVGPFGLGPFELLLILAIVVLIFGVGKMADIGGALGKSIREFRKAAREPEEAATPTVSANSETAASSAAPTERHCTKCGASVDPSSRFCAECGAPVQAAVN